ncbi:MAG: hypothetical protein QOI98_1086 [Solirubrobacteraceae bacterium]|jgi:hypothetical protein|nr:hypothetical protein [Solirubrobacteraceae bacterium]
MSRGLLRTTVVGFVVVATGLPASAAAADGPPIFGLVAGPGGVSLPGSAVRYVSLPAGRGSVVAQIRQAGGRVAASLYFKHGEAIPAIAADGSASGLSADGRTLVVTPPRNRFPQLLTRLTLLDTVPLRPRSEIALRGDYGFDAISPDGGVIYLIHYLSPTNPLRYEVRAYDVQARRMDPKPVVDPRERDEKMRGYAVTRAMSADGRWAYTLYQGGEHPFVHALDTVRRTARCIDLPELSGDLSALRLRLEAGGRRLVVADNAEPAANIDTRTFRVSAPPVVAYTPPSQTEGGGESSWMVMGGTGLGVLALAGASAALLRRRRID